MSMITPYLHLPFYPICGDDNDNDNRDDVIVTTYLGKMDVMHRGIYTMTSEMIMNDGKIYKNLPTKWRVYSSIWHQISI